MEGFAVDDFFDKEDVAVPAAAGQLHYHLSPESSYVQGLVSSPSPFYRLTIGGGRLHTVTRLPRQVGNMLESVLLIVPTRESEGHGKILTNNLPFQVFQIIYTDHHQASFKEWLAPLVHGIWIIDAQCVPAGRAYVLHMMKHLSRH